jgi:hypothetical protein
MVRRREAPSRTMATEREGPGYRFARPGYNSHRHRPGDPVFQSADDEHERSGILDHPLEPVIGLAEGETRWRVMTVEDVG